MTKKIKHLDKDNAFSFFLHQDNLMWSRIQTIEAIQAGGLASTYYLRSIQWFSICVLCITVILTLLIFFLLKRDELIREKINKEIKGLDWSVPRKWYSPFRGREITWIIFLTLISADLLFGLGIIFEWF